MQILTACHQPDQGTMILDGRPVSSRPRRKRVPPRDQHRLPGTAPGADAEHRREHLRQPPAGAAARLHRLARAAPPGARAAGSLRPRDSIRPRPCGALPPAKQQVVEILKAISTEPKVLILDEPTSSLTDRRRGASSTTSAGSTSAGWPSSTSRTTCPRSSRSPTVTVLRDGKFVCDARGGRDRRGLPGLEHGGPDHHRHLRHAAGAVHLRPGPVRGPRPVRRPASPASLPGPGGRDRRVLRPGWRGPDRAGARHLRRRPARGRCAAARRRAHRTRRPATPSAAASAISPRTARPRGSTSTSRSAPTWPPTAWTT